MTARMMHVLMAVVALFWRREDKMELKKLVLRQV